MNFIKVTSTHKRKNAFYLRSDLVVSVYVMNDSEDEHYGKTLITLIEGSECRDYPVRETVEKVYELLTFNADFNKMLEVGSPAS